MGMFKEHTSNEHAKSIASYMPDGKAWIAKNTNGTNLNKLLIGFGAELLRIEKKMNEISREHYINETQALIDRWESAIGIPDDCFKLTSSLTLAERINQILLKLKAEGTSTEQDFIDLAALLGITISIQSGIEISGFPFTFPIIFFADAKDARFTLVINVLEGKSPNVFPFTFPITFTEDNFTIMECLFRKLKPANVNVIFRYL